MNSEQESQASLRVLMLGALGVVFGDIGTSPLYALRECFFGPHALEPTPDNVVGVLSLIFWSLILIVSIKYLCFVMRADNKGEGGILALLALALPDRSNLGRRGTLLLMLGILGAALLYGDGIITPAVTVLSAVEGLNVATKVFEPYILPISVTILVLLFAIQRHGTGKVGNAFGPIMVIWFVVLAVMGVRGIFWAPQVLKAFSPFYAATFFLHAGNEAFFVLGAVFLALTGAEALYADMGHFGIKPIRRAWFYLVLPSLFLNYLGQGALLMKDPGVAENPFYHLAPASLHIPLVCLATMAAVIASQALISGAYSLTMQAVQLGLLPRLAVHHTSSVQKGQIYVPQANWVLMLACIGIVLGFGSSSRLTAAYGVAVTLTMLMTTLLFFFAARSLWSWGFKRTLLLVGFVGVIELCFFMANIVKIRYGGWVPLVIGAAVLAVMTTWRRGRILLRERLSAGSLPLDLFLQEVDKMARMRVPGTAVFMSGNPQGTPLALLHNLKHNKVLHERNILMTVSVTEAAHVELMDQLEVLPLKEGFYRVVGRYGFMDQPDIPAMLLQCKQRGLDINLQETTYFLSSETIVPGKHPRMAPWREWLFALLARNAQRATAFFRLPANRVVELGMQVEL